MGAGLEVETERRDNALSRAPTRLIVQGMTCSNCARHVTEAIQSVPSVESASVDLEKGQATVRWRSGSASDQAAVFRAIREAGYEPQAPRQPTTQLAVAGMTCSGCARNVTQALRNVPGIDGADVQLDEGRAIVQWQPDFPVDEDALIKAVERAGFDARLVGAGAGKEPTSKWSPFSGWQFNVVVGSILTLPLFVLEWGMGVGTERWYHWLAFAVVLPVQLICGARFYRGAWNQLKIGSSNMDTLVVLGSTAAFAFSTWGLFAAVHGHLYFMESASIITLISVGHWMESKVSARAAKSLRALLNLSPPTARWLDPGGAEVEVPVSQLKVGDQVVVKPGDRVPIDSEVVEGASIVDESMLTGESMPVNKNKGSRIYGGTVNLHGWLLGRVAATGEGTALAQIIAVVQRAQTSRANIQKLGDRVSSIFVPVVVMVALGAGLWWGFAPESARAVSDWMEPFLWRAHHPTGTVAAAIYHAVAVLIIACPCAMGLATPIAIMAGANVAAERGILIRDGVALEKTGTITSVLFDKTGTLTQGRMGLADSEDFLESAAQPVGFHKVAASLGRPSNHPLSQAVAGLSNVTFTPKEWEEVRGAGVQAKLDIPEPSLQGALLRLGSLAWMRESGVDLAPGLAFIEKWSGRGATLLAVAADQRLIGLLALRDTIKEAAGEVVETLARQGITPYMVTGDNQATAAAIAAQVGILPENVFAEVRPEAKATVVQTLQKRGARVAFVGDGINDAPALEQADLGIAVAKASDVAREAADMILLNSDIHAVPESLALAQATLRTIKQNLFWAFFYNACGVPLAAFGFLSPIMSAFAMGASDLIVIGNALRLRRWKFRRR
ncbi:MAG: heavy metal translocating P-type ATPase [Verrucomicrobiia bacterium]